MVVCKFAYHESVRLLISPEVLNELNGHHFSVGHEEPSGL